MAKTNWSAPRKGWGDGWDKYSAMFCNHWKCCPSDWNRENPRDPITRAEWRREQHRIDRLLRKAAKGRVIERYANAVVFKDKEN